MQLPLRIASEDMSRCAWRSGAKGIGIGIRYRLGAQPVLSHAQRYTVIMFAPQLLSRGSMRPGFSGSELAGATPPKLG